MQRKVIERIILSLPASLAAGFIIRISSIAFIDFSSFNWTKPRPDLLMEYGVIARNLASGFGYSYTWYDAHGAAITLPSAFMPPGLVFIEYLFISLFGYTVTAAIAIFLVNVILGIGFIWLAGRITHALFHSELATGIARWIAALYPPFIYAAMSFGITAWVLFLNSLVLLCVIKLTQSIIDHKPYTRAAIILGITSGALTLFRGEGFLFIIVGLGMLLIKLPRKKAIRPVLLSSFVAFLMILPWTVRNWVVFERFIPVSSNGSFNFWRGNNELSSGSPLTENGAPLWTTEELMLEPKWSSGATFENMSSDRYREAAFTWIKNNPLQAIGLALKKGIIFWTFDARNKLVGWWYYLLHSLALITVILGMLELRRGTRDFSPTSRISLSIIGAWTILTTIIAMVFLPLARFQIITMSLLVPIAAYGMGRILGRRVFVAEQDFHFTPLIKES